MGFLMSGLDIINAVSPEWLINQHFASNVVTQVAVDSRNVTQVGALFAAVSLRSDVTIEETVWYILREPENGFYFNHHDFIMDAIKRGARFILCEQLPKEPDKRVIYVGVDNVIRALTLLTKYIIEKSNSTVVSVTGSSGKTTTVHTIYQALNQLTPNVGKVYTQRPTPISLSLGILNLFCGKLERNPYLVLEMPTDHHGCITTLTSFTPPDVGVVLNVRAAHINTFGSPAAIAQAKSELVTAVKDGGAVVLNYDDPLVRQMASVVKPKQNIISGGTQTEASVWGQIVERTPTGTRCRIQYQGKVVEFEFPLIGSTGIHIIIATISVCLAFGFSLQKSIQGLEKFQAMPGRMEWIFLDKGRIRVFNNTEKCNAVNLKHLIESIKEAGWFGKKVLILGNFDSSEHLPLSPQDWTDITCLFDMIVLPSETSHHYKKPLTYVAPSATIKVFSTVEKASRFIIEYTSGNDCFVCATGWKKDGTYKIIDSLKEVYGN